jgi:ATP-dependent Clp protease ATP-binding subunit ClpE
MFLSGALKDVVSLKIDYRKDKFVFDTVKAKEE